MSDDLVVWKELAEVVSGLTLSKVIKELAELAPTTYFTLAAEVRHVGIGNDVRVVFHYYDNTTGYRPGFTTLEAVRDFAKERLSQFPPTLREEQMQRVAQCDVENIT